MEKVEVAFFGILLGCLHGFILRGFLTAFATASFILYGNIYTIPFWATAIIDILLIAGVLSYTWWVNSAQNAIVWLAGALQKGGDELE